MGERVLNILRGMGSVLEIAPPPLNHASPAKVRRQSDSQAIGGDWRRVGDDLREAIARCRPDTGAHGQPKQEK